MEMQESPLHFGEEEVKQKKRMEMKKNTIILNARANLFLLVASGEQLVRARTKFA